MVEHPIEKLITTAMENIKGMVDVQTIVGRPVETLDGHVIIPVSRVSLGFLAGGSEFEKKEKKSDEEPPFGGGSGAGISLSPVAFLVVGGGQVRLLPINSNTTWERLLAGAPELLAQLQSLMKGDGSPPTTS